MSQHHARAGWSAISKKLRPRVKASLPQPCGRCGQPVMPDQPFDLGHRIDLAKGGDINDVWPEHVKCSRRSGGRAGAAKTNTYRRTQGNQRSERLPNW